MELVSDALRYPIGRFKAPEHYTDDVVRNLITAIESFPVELRKEVKGLDDRRLDTPYRDGGWTIRQVIHHLADSHMNGYIRFKLALTEDNPVIKPYAEERWAELGEARHALPELSLLLLDSLHARWTASLKTLTPADFAKTFYHPASKTEMTLYRTLALYAWHGNHHLGHITSLKERMGW